MSVIITMVIVGLLVGFLARAGVPGRDPMGIGATILLGVGGSVIGDLLGDELFGRDTGPGALQPSSMVGLVIGAITALLVCRRTSHRKHSLV